MQGILKDFKPLMKNGSHDKYNDFWKFEVTIEADGSTITGEALAKTESGSKNWKIGAMHEFEKKPNEYALNGTGIKGLKILEQTSSGSEPVNIRAMTPHDMDKEIYVISRFAHNTAIEFYKACDEEKKKTLFDKYQEEIISKLAKPIAISVYEVAQTIRDLHAKRNSKAA